MKCSSRSIPMNANMDTALVRGIAAMVISVRAEATNMATLEIVHTSQGFCLYSWPDGYKRVRLPCTPKTESDVLAQAMWLEKHHRHDEADELIERFLEHQSHKKR